jgi:hypothetical protein
MTARVVATSKCREKTKEPILAKEMPPPYVSFYPPLSPAPSFSPSTLTLDGETQKTVTLVKSGPEISGASTALIFLSPMGPMPTTSPPVLTSHPPFNQGHPTSLHEDPSSLLTTTALKIPPREVQDPVYYDQDIKYKKEDGHSSTSPLPPQTY